MGGMVACALIPCVLSLKNKKINFQQKSHKTTDSLTVDYIPVLGETYLVRLQ
jgi:hypothetical protein